MKALGIATKWLFILCLPILLLTASLGWAINSLWLYKYGFQKYSVNQTTGLTKVELDKVATGLIDYFNSGEEYISIRVVKDGKPFELFNQQEVAHLRDVKGLIWLDYYLLLGTLVYAVGYAGVSLIWRKRRYWRRLAWGMVGGGGITLAFMLVLSLETILSFDQLFLQFHLLSFSNELWQLDPSKDYLIMLFPQGFFYDAAMFCALVAVGLAIILGGAAGSYLALTRSKATPSL